MLHRVATMLRSTLLALALAACAADPATSPTHSGGGGGKADGSEPTITFAGDFTDSVDGTLLAGSPVRVSYDLDRLQTCRGASMGSEVWGVSGYAQFDGQDPVAFEVSRLDQGKVVPVDAELALPASASHVAMWFQISNTWGCSAYDSNEGANYQFDIDRHGLGAVLSFDADFTNSQSAAIHAGDQIVVHYAPERLSQCAATSNGQYPGWGVTMHWQVDGGSVHDVMAARADGANLVAADPVITMPRGHDLAMWFEATSVYGCDAFDSAYGANYHFTIE